MDQENKSHEFPEGWIIVSLKDLVIDPKSDFVDGPFGSNLKADEYTNKGVPVFRIQNIKAGHFVDKNIKFVTEAKAEEIQRHSFKSGDIIITKLGEPLGLCCKVPTKYSFGIIVADLIRIRPSPIIINTDYLVYAINSKFIKDQFKKITKGTTRARVNLTVVRDILIPLAPIHEQNKIVEKIDEFFSELDTAENSLLRIAKQIEIYRHAILKDAFTGKMTKQWREENKTESSNEFIQEINQYKSRLFAERLKLWEENKKVNKKPKSIDCVQKITNDESANIPQQWNLVSLGSITEVIRGASPRPAGDTRFFGGNIPWITVGEITKDDKIYLTTVSNFLTELGCSESRFIKKDSLLLSNSGATLGVPKITLIDGCINDGSVALLDIVNSELQLFLYWLLKSKTIQLRKNSQGAGQPNLNTEIVKNIRVPLPSLREQIQITQELDFKFTLADNLDKIIRETLLMIKGTKSGILNKAFAGKLVEQNSSDPSATILLDSLKRQRQIYNEDQKQTISRPKKEKIMEEKKSILEVLSSATGPLAAKDVWLQSQHKDDIELFYAELRQIESKIIEVKKDTESLLSIRHENR